MKRLTLAVLVGAGALLVARELRSNPSLPRALTREVRRLVTAKLPPLALVPLAALIDPLFVRGLFALAGPP
ncbi:MAG: hypothetical protein IPK07_00290 [Deltaproteobacteria bacterium]|nr:hypothetical protein [Deltaproteobacteria bacterium]